MAEDPVLPGEQFQINAIWNRAGHDLRQPIQALLLLNHLMAGTDDRGRRLETERTIEDTLLALQAMLDDIALLARLDAGLEAKPVSTCKLPALLTKVALDASGLADEMDVKIGVRCEVASVRTNARLLQLVVAGLVENALKCQNGPRIDLIAERHASSNQIRITYAGAALRHDDTAAAFVELRCHYPGHQTIRPIPGLAYWGQMVKHFGATLHWGAAGKHRRQFVIRLP